VEAYTAFYEVIKDILRKYGASVTVFSIEEENRNIVLYAGGFEEEIINLEKKEKYRNPIEDWRAVRLLDTLLENPIEFFDKLVEALIEAAEENKEQIAKLQFALKLVKALSEEEKGDNKN
jgi:hypothetical protein